MYRQRGGGGGERRREKEAWIMRTIWHDTPVCGGREKVRLAGRERERGGGGGRKKISFCLDKSALLLQCVMAYYID